MAKTTKKTEDKNAYDEVVYESFAYPQTHHTHLYTVANLFGMNPVDFKHANVLELGCAGGGNLAPLAYAYPEASFFGIDISQEQVTQAEHMREKLGFDNLEFQQQDIMKFKPRNKREKYDYIICHGIFSWVPEVVRTRIFEICNEYLSDNGLAIISYNALPGWNAVRSLRDMMIYHVKRFDNPVDKINQARLLLQFLADNVNKSNASYLGIIENEIQLLSNANASYFYHDHLEGENEQFYLSDFVKMAREHNLEYVGDTNVSSMYIGNMPQDAMDKLKVINDIVDQEQYMDFIKNRRFRSSILCKQGNNINRNLVKEKILDYYLSFTSPATVSEESSEKKVTFNFAGFSFDTNEEISTTLFKELAAQGIKPIHAKELIKITQEKLGLNGSEVVETILLNNGLNLLLRGFINIYSDIPSYVSDISQKPEAYKVARYEAAMNNYSRNKVNNVFSNVVTTDVITNIIIASLDGKNTLEDVLNILLKNAKNNVINVQLNGVQVKDEAQLREILQKGLEGILPKLAEKAFLIS